MADDERLTPDNDYTATRAAVLAEVEAAIIAAAPPINSELLYDGSEDPTAAAYVEGFKDAWQVVSDLIAQPATGQRQTPDVLPCCTGQGECQSPPDIGPCAPLAPTNRERLGLPEPDCTLGYTTEQLALIFDFGLGAFQRWMRGQTAAICDGRRYDHEAKEYEPTDCGPHGQVIYTWDVEQYLAGGGPRD